MSFKTKTIVTAALMGLAFASPAFADPQLTIKSEEAAHPRIMKAIHEMDEALKELKEAPHDFGGNKGKAMADTSAAIHSLKKALYYRLKMDDAAIDRAQ
jgi:cytochrome c556